MTTPSAVNGDETALFRQAWTLYDTITAMNYMFHREIYSLVAAVLKQRHGGGPYSLLDLGCGNARFMAPCFAEAPPSRYDGVDLSAAALQEAREHLAALKQVTLHHQDMLHAARQADAAFDVIFTSFAVHHLDAEEKQQLFHACAARLAPGGMLMMVDIVREENQSREEYLERYLETMRARWTQVRPDHLEEACAHVAAFDFPETLSSLARMASAAGLSQMQLLQRHDQHHVIAFTA